MDGRDALLLVSIAMLVGPSCSGREGQGGPDAMPFDVGKPDAMESRLDGSVSVADASLDLFDSGLGLDASSSADAGASDAGMGPRVVQLSVGWQHTCVLVDDGSVRCWGDGLLGRLGYGSSDDIGDDEHPYTAGTVELEGPVQRLFAGGHHSCFLRTEGAMRCWGYGGRGRLGYGSIESIGDDETPSQLTDVAVGGPVASIGLGGHSCAVLDTGAVRCWGTGDDGQLGYGNTVTFGDDELPEVAGDIPLGGTAVQVAAGLNHSCALLDTGAVRCWGDGFLGRLGYGNTDDIGDNESPSSAGDIDLGGTAVQISLGWSHSCAFLDTGAVRCWGANSNGLLGYGHSDPIGDDETPATAGDLQLGGPATKISAGATRSCALMEGGAVRCWGRATFSPLGYGNTENIGDDEHPESAGDVPLGEPAVDIGVGVSHSCALLESGRVLCWGDGQDGRLGYSSTADVGGVQVPADVGPVAIFPP